MPPSPRFLDNRDVYYFFVLFSPSCFSKINARLPASRSVRHHLETERVGRYESLSCGSVLGLFYLGSRDFPTNRTREVFLGTSGATSFFAKMASLHNGTCPCDLLPSVVSGTCPLVCTDLIRNICTYKLCGK